MIKTKLLLAGIIFSLNSFKAQVTFNKAYHQFNEKACPFIVQIGSDLFFSSNTLNAPALDQSNLYKHNSAGNLIFRQSLPMPSPPNIGFKTLDNQLLMAGGREQCGLPQAVQTNYIVKYNTNGSLLFNSTYTVYSGSNVKACLQLSDSSYASFTDSLMIKHNKQGQLISKIYLGFGSVSSALLLSNNNILLSAKTGALNMLLEIAPTGTIVTLTMAPALFNKILNYGGQNKMALATNGQLYKFSTSLNLLGNSNFTSGQTVVDFAIKRDTVYTIQTSSTVPNSYVLADTLFNTISTSSTTTNKIEQLAILPLLSNEVGILSTGIAHVSPNFYINDLHYYTSLHVMPKQASHNFTEDIALLDVVKDSSYTTFTGNPVSTQGKVYLRVKAKIKYLGSGKLTSFKLNVFERPHVECGNYYYQEEFNQLNVLPGDTAWVTGTLFSFKFVYSATQTVQTNECYYVSLPNGQVDKNLADNELCKSFGFVITKTRENLNNADQIQVYPIPFSRHLTVKSEEGLESIQLLDGLGKEVYFKDLSGKSEDVTLPDLSPGIYFAKLKSKEYEVFKKLIRE